MLLKNNLEHLLLTHSKHAYKSEIKEGKSLFEIWSDEMDKKAEERAKIKKEEDIKELRKKLNNIKSKQAARRMINPILQKALFAQDLAVLYEIENFLKNKYITLPEKSDKQNTQNSKPLELKNDDMLSEVQDLLSSFSEDASSNIPYNSSSLNMSTQSFTA